MALLHLKQGTRLNRTAVFWITFVHLGAFAALFFFTKSALILCLCMLFTISPLGVTLTYHRLLTHRSFRVPRWLEYFLAIIGAISAQGSPILWVAGHRIHHQHSDSELDPHTPKKGFFFSHMGHLMVTCDNSLTPEQMMKYAPDLANQKFYRFLDRNHLWISLSVLPLHYLFGGWSFVLWGGFMRVVLMLHITWFVNSATHQWGYQNYATRDNSRNLWWVALLAAGEGWHNNHHAQQNSAAHGHKWWEVDLTWMIIQGLEAIGLATQVKRPKLNSASALN